MPSRVLAGLLLAAALAAACRGSGGGRAVTFRTEDGFRLSGHVFGSDSRAAVLSHMFPSDQSSWFGLARDLAGDGYQALVFDFRGYGESQGGKDVALLDRDVRAAARFAGSERRGTKVVLVGASMGGTASLIAAASLPVAGVATLSAPVRFQGLDAGPALSRVTVPVLVIAGAGDEPAAAAAEEIFRGVGGGRDLQIVAGPEHGTDLLGGRRGTEVNRMLVQFVAEVTG